MDERKKIIIKEIKYWKDHKLLPSHYCDFLLSLYSEGTISHETDKKSKRSVLLLVVTSVISFALLLITFLVIYFTDFLFVLQMALLLIFSLLAFFFAWIALKKGISLYHFPIFIGALILFITSVEFTTYMFPENPIAIFVTVALTCFLWIGVGYRFNLKYLSISGGTGLILLSIFLFFWLL